MTHQIAELDQVYSSGQLAKFKQQAQDAYNHAVASVNGAIAENIDTEKNAGLNNIYQALADAKLQSVKNKANSFLDEYAKGAIQNDPRDADMINSERDKAKAKVDKAKNQDDVQKAQDEGHDIMKGIIDTVNDKNMNAAKDSAKNDLADSIGKLQQQIDQDLANKKLGQDQYNDLKNKLDQVRQSGESRINSTVNKDQLLSDCLVKQLY